MAIMQNMELNFNICSQFPCTALSASNLLQKHVGVGTCGSMIWIFAKHCIQQP